MGQSHVSALDLESGGAQSSMVDYRSDVDAKGEQSREIVNPISGERIIIRVSGAQTRGQLLVFDLYLPPGGHVPAKHSHPIQEERFTVIAGLMRFRLGRREILAGPGETVTIPPRTPHWFEAAGAAPAQARVEARPALRTQEMFERTEALGQTARRVAGRRLWRLEWVCGLAQVVLEYQREVAAPYLPAVVAQVALSPLAWLGRRRGRSASRV